MAPTDPPPSPHSNSNSCVDKSGAAGLNPTAGNKPNLFVNVSSSSSVVSKKHKINMLLHSSAPAEGNSEEVHVGKISFSPTEVLGHGTAGTFVFRYSVWI